MSNETYIIYAISKELIVNELDDPTLEITAEQMAEIAYRLSDLAGDVFADVLSITARDVLGLD